MLMTIFPFYIIIKKLQIHDYSIQQTKLIILMQFIRQDFNFWNQEIIIINWLQEKVKMDFSDVAFKNLEKCPYCSLPFERTPKSQPRVMRCGHSVCSQCIKNQVKQNKGLICPYCNKSYNKADCAQFQINYFYLDLIECLDQNFGRQLSDQIQSIGGLQQFNIFSGSQNVPKNNFCQSKDQLRKCLNSQCKETSMYPFCSQYCQNHFEQVQTEKDEGNNFMRRNNEFDYEI